MRLTLCLAMLLTAAAAGAQPRGGPAPANRARVIAALERLMATGEPRHTSHDEGEWLQREVDAAIAGRDREVERLAQRAATPLLARVSSPVSPTRDLPSLSIEMQKILTVPRPHTYTARVSVSVDGGELFELGTFSKGQGASLGTLLPQAARRPGLHHLRLRAELTFPAGSGLARETRDLPEIVYALYDAEAGTPFDARVFVEAAAAVSVQRLDGSLPAVPFDAWLRTLTAQHGEPFDPATQWRTAYCDERLIDGGAHARTRDICAIADFAVKDGAAGIGHIWIRTGHIDFTESEVRWLAETPALEGIVLRGVEIDRLSALPDLFRTAPEAWPAGDLVVTPEDVTVAVQGNVVQLTASMRNAGGATLRGVIVHVVAGTGGKNDVKRAFVVDVPKQGTATIAAELPLLSRYGFVVVHGLQLSEHAAFEMGTPDPTPEDAMAFRIVNPRQAPRGYADWIKAQCGPCQGY